MREIKFRGKRVDNGKWVYGDLIQLYDDRKFIINNKFGDCIDDKGNIIYVETPIVGYFDYDIEVIGNVSEVITETVGQHTGLKDKNGKEIYEGDIVEKKLNGFEWKGVIEKRYSNNMYWFGFERNFDKDHNSDEIIFQVTKHDERQDVSFMSLAEVIGNIHDNPELLKEV